MAGLMTSVIWHYVTPLLLPWSLEAVPYFACFFAAGEAFKAYNEDYYPLALSEYDRMIFLVYYLESVYGKPWVENGEVQYTEEEIATGMDFINNWKMVM